MMNANLAAALARLHDHIERKAAIAMLQHRCSVEHVRRSVGQVFRWAAR